MANDVAHIKKEWRVYVMAAWMIGITGFLFYLSGRIEAISQTEMKLSSDVDSVESILISTDANVSQIKKQVEEISSKVAVLHKRVMRR
ncbi:MAG: hypothetical protein WBY88_12135 [Desulfosarcina sp.]